MDRSERDFDVVAEVSRVYCGLFCDWERDWNLGRDRRVCSDGAGDAVYGRSGVFCGDRRATVGGAVA